MSRILDMFVSLWTLATRMGNAFSWVSPTLARLAVGMVFFQSGWGKLHDLAKVTDYFTELGLPAPAFQALLTSTTVAGPANLAAGASAAQTATLRLMPNLDTWRPCDSLETAVAWVAAIERRDGKATTP